MKTTTALQKAVKEDEFVDRSLSTRITELGSENCKHDFRWACLTLNAAIQDKYSDQSSAAHFVIQNSDTFFIPMMAALGSARGQQSIRSAMENRQAKLIEIVKNSKDPESVAAQRQGARSVRAAGRHPVEHRSAEARPSLRGLEELLPAGRLRHQLANRLEGCSSLDVNGEAVLASTRAIGSSAVRDGRFVEVPASPGGRGDRSWSARRC